jgi:hypothetical protein
MALIVLLINAHTVLAGMASKAHEHSLDKSVVVRHGYIELTYLMEAHAWLAVLAEARRSRARMAQGTLAKAAVVSSYYGQRKSALGSCLGEYSGGPNKQTNIKISNSLKRLRVLPLEEETVDHVYSRSALSGSIAMGVDRWRRGRVEGL